jgi:protein-disulfide isomerase
MRPFSRKALIQLLIAVVIGVGVSQWLLRTAPLGRDVSGNPAAQAALVDEVAPSSTPADPTLTLVVFTDYQCPACKGSNPAMDAAVAKDGRVRVIYRDWPILGPVSDRAARVAIAAGRQGIYPEVHRQLMDEWRRIDDQVLRDAVEVSGGDWDKVQADLTAHRDEITAQLVRTNADVLALGIRGTPAYLAGTRLVAGGLDEAGFEKLFALARDR